MNDPMGDRMKLFEGMEAGRKFLPLLPVCARLDGKCFSSYTKNLKRPYDERFSNLMIATTKYLVESTNAKMGYTQSDEISLVFYQERYDSQIFFDGKIQKMVSVLTSMATAYFNAWVSTYLQHAKPEKLALFDCRIWQMPNLEEAANVFLWREFDATKNSITMAAQEFYSHKELHEKSGAEKQEMLFQKGINWNDYPAFFKRGTYIQRKHIPRKFTTEEIEKLPAKHKAKTDPDLVVIRTEVQPIVMPIFSSVTNRAKVVFDGAVPCLSGLTQHNI